MLYCAVPECDAASQNALSVSSVECFNMTVVFPEPLYLCGMIEALSVSTSGEVSNSVDLGLVDVKEEVISLTPCHQATRLNLAGPLTISGDQACHLCVVGKPGNGVVSGHTVRGVEKGTGDWVAPVLSVWENISPTLTVCDLSFRKL